MKKYLLFLSVLLSVHVKGTIRQLSDVLTLAKTLTAVVQADSDLDYSISEMIASDIDEKLTEAAAKTEDLSLTDENSKNILIDLFASHGFDITNTIESVFLAQTNVNNTNPTKPEVSNELDQLIKDVGNLILNVNTVNNANNELEKLITQAATAANSACPICLETIAKKDQTIISKKCKHFICKECKKGLQKPFVPNPENPHATVAHTCPVCRESIDHTI